MGPRKFNKLHGEYAIQVHVNELKGTKMCFDQAYHLHRIMRGIKKRRNNTNIENILHEYIDKKSLSKKCKTIDEMIAFEDSIAHTIANVSLINLIIDRQIFPVYVLDGRAPDLKKKTLNERKRVKNNALIEREKKINMELNITNVIQNV